MDLLGQQFQALGVSHKNERPLVPEKDNAEPAFVPFVMAQSETPQEPEKKQGVLGSIKPKESYRLGGYIER